MTGDRHNGLDLSNGTVGVELKSRWRKYGFQYAVAGEQVDAFPAAHPNLELWWAFLLYDITGTPTDIEWGDDIEPFVSYREVWFMKWDWVRRFPVSDPKTGPYRYVSGSSFPANLETFVYDGITFHCPTGSGLQDKLIPF